MRNSTFICINYFFLFLIDQMYALHISLVLRIRCDAKIAQCPLGEKYGCNPKTEALDLFRLAKSLNLNVSTTSRREK